MSGMIKHGLLATLVVVSIGVGLYTWSVSEAQPGENDRGILVFSGDFGELKQIYRGNISGLRAGSLRAVVSDARIGVIPSPHVNTTRPIRKVKFRLSQTNLRALSDGRAQVPGLVRVNTAKGLTRLPARVLLELEGKVDEKPNALTTDGETGEVFNISVRLKKRRGRRGR